MTRTRTTRRRVDDSRRVAHPKLEGGGLFFANRLFCRFFQTLFRFTPATSSARTLVTFHFFQSKSQKSQPIFCQMTLVFSSILLEHPQMLFVAGAHKQSISGSPFVDSFVKIGQFPITPHHTASMHGCTYAHPTTAAAQTPTTASKPHHLGSVIVNFQALPPLVGKGHFSFAIYGCSDGSVF